VNGNDQPNPKGHNRSLNAALYFRMPRMVIGSLFGGRLSQEATFHRELYERR
jgi:hypothetical protein